MTMNASGPTSSGRRRRPAVIAAAVVTTLALVGAACGDDGGDRSAGSAAPTATAALASTSAPPSAAPGASIDWAPCDPGFECAEVPVPLDWADPTGEQIELSVIRYPATKPDQRIGAMFFNPGGPGDTGVGLVRDAGKELSEWGDGRFDIVSWDPRGTHASSPVHCFESDAEEAAFWKDVALPFTSEESAAFQLKLVDLAQRCADVMGELLSHVSTADTARDLDALRAASGEEQITYVGFSYGSVLGQTYANMFPERVRAMMLDGIVDAVAYTASAEDRAMSNASSADAVYDQFATLCDQAGPTRCALAGHPGQTAAQRVDQLFETLRTGTIPAPNADPPGDLVYTDLQLSSFSALRDPNLWPAWAEQLNAAADGDASELKTQARLWQLPKSWAEATKSSAISCLDGPAKVPSTEWPTVIPELDEISRWEGAIQGWWIWAPCASDWPAHGDDRYAGPWDATTDAPILVIGTRYDPNTSYENAERVAERFGNAVLLTHDGYGHVSDKDHSTCIEEWRVKYLVDLVAPAPGTVCAADKKPFAP
jgi:pimeloyl-ACP methyl ester carboxylesterase